MPKINFELVTNDRILPPQVRNSYHKFARCDLARPTGELNCLADLIATRFWNQSFLEHEGAIFFEIDEDIHWDVQERAFHTVLIHARRALESALAHLRKTKPEPVATPHFYPGRLPTIGYRTYIRGGGGYVMPDGYGVGFVVDEFEHHGLEGYYLTNSMYDRADVEFATMLLAIHRPDYKIGPCNRRDYQQIAILDHAADLEAQAVAAYHAAQAMRDSFKRSMDELQWKGKPSAFLDEDDDARDLLLAEMIAGGKIHRHQDPAPKDLGYDFSKYRYTADDGSQIPNHIVSRLLNAFAIDVAIEDDLPDEPSQHNHLPPLTVRANLKSKILNPRANAVRFEAFQSYCAHRVHDDECYHECDHEKVRSELCNERSCPLASQCYREDAPNYSLLFKDDPAFHDYDDEDFPDPLVRALDPETEKSPAWLAAGQDAALVIVNEAAHAKFRMGIDNYLVETSRVRAARQAIDQGHLNLVQELSGHGIIVTPSASLISAFAAAQPVPLAVS